MKGLRELLKWSIKHKFLILAFITPIILFTISLITFSILAIQGNLLPELSPDGFNKFLDYYDFPLKVFAAFLITMTLSIAIYRSIQTEKLIRVNTEQNRVSNYYKFKEELLTHFENSQLSRYFEKGESFKRIIKPRIDELFGSFTTFGEDRIIRVVSNLEEALIVLQDSFINHNFYSTNEFANQKLELHEKARKLFTDAFYENNLVSLIYLTDYHIEFLNKNFSYTPQQASRLEQGYVKSFLNIFLPALFVKILNDFLGDDLYSVDIIFSNQEIFYKFLDIEGF